MVNGYTEHYPMGKLRVIVGLAVALAVALHLVAAVCSQSLDHPLSEVRILEATNRSGDAFIDILERSLGTSGETSQMVTVVYKFRDRTINDWVGVFSPPDFSEGCEEMDTRERRPLICRAPIKYQFCNVSRTYMSTGAGTMRLELRNQRSEFSFVLFTGGLEQPQVIAVSRKTASFADPKAPVFPRLAQGHQWNQMVVTWTSGYDPDEAEPFVEFGHTGAVTDSTPAETITFDRRSMCGSPARDVGWRNPGYIHTSVFSNLVAGAKYSYRLGHRILADDTFVYSSKYEFKASPHPGQKSPQRVVLFGAKGKGEIDGSTGMDEYQPGSLNTTKQLVRDLENIDMVFHIGDLSCAKGYISQWDHFTAQIEPIASTVPYMVASGDRDRDYPNTGSFYTNADSGGECGVPAKAMFFVPSKNKATFRYSTDFGMFRFCVADTSADWREGTEQHRFIEQCFASADRRKQPWLVFVAHRVLGYSSEKSYAQQGSFGEPMGIDHVQELLQKYKVDLAVFGHAHHYERSCPIYQHKCSTAEKSNYRGNLQGTINLVVGGGGAILSEFTELQTDWSLHRDKDYGFGKLTAFNHTTLLFEYKRSSDGKVYDSFTITKEYRDILACSFDSCPRTTLAS